MRTALEKRPRVRRVRAECCPSVQVSKCRLTQTSRDGRPPQNGSLASYVRAACCAFVCNHKSLMNVAVVAVVVCKCRTALSLGAANSESYANECLHVVRRRATRHTETNNSQRSQRVKFEITQTCAVRSQSRNGAKISQFD